VVSITCGLVYSVLSVLRFSVLLVSSTHIHKHTHKHRLSMYLSIIYLHAHDAAPALAHASLYPPLPLSLQTSYDIKSCFFFIRRLSSEPPSLSTVYSMYWHISEVLFLFSIFFINVSTVYVLDPCVCVCTHTHTDTDTKHICKHTYTPTHTPTYIHTYTPTHLRT
jgi:hypothetical protein